MPIKVCYFIQSHRDPEQILRLVRRIRRGSAGRIVVQHNFASCPLDWSPFAELPDTHLFRASRPQIRHNFSCQVQPYLEFIDALEREGVEYDWLVNLTAQDYPVAPIETSESFLAATSADAFIRFWDVRSAASQWPRRKGLARYSYRYRRWPDWTERPLHAFQGITRLLPIHFYLGCGPWVGVRPRRTPYGPDFRCYGGWAWFALRRNVVRYLRDFLAERPDVLEHYRHVMVAEESIVQTVLVNSGRFTLVNDDLRYIDYSKAIHGSPRTMTVADLPLLGSGRYQFARKFDLGSGPELFDRIDRELLGIDPASA